MTLDLRDIAPIGPFEFRWPNAMESFDRGWEGTVVVDGHPRRFRHGVGGRHVYGRQRVHTVTWLDGQPAVEGVEADDYDRSRALLSRIKRPDGKLARTLAEVPPGHGGFLIVTHHDEIDAPYSPTGLAMKVREDDLEAWVQLAWLRLRDRSQLATRVALPKSAPGGGVRNHRRGGNARLQGPSAGLTAIVDLRTMSLERLAAYLRLYEEETGYDQDLHNMRSLVGESLDLADAAHRDAVLGWLRDWGMVRHLRRPDHALSSSALQTWAEQWIETLPPRGIHLTELSPSQIDGAAVAYGQLAASPAATRLYRGEQRTKVFGPTAAAKVLFVLRPEAFPPWDMPIRGSLGLGENAAAYRSYLLLAADLLTGLAERAGADVGTLPSLVGRDESTAAKLIDEYFWVRLSRRREP